MCIDKPRHDNHAATVKLSCITGIQADTDGNDHAVADVHIGAFQVPNLTINTEDMRLTDDNVCALREHDLWLETRAVRRHGRLLAHLYGRR